MLRKFSSAVSSLTSSPAPNLAATHRGVSRAQHNVELAKDLEAFSVPADESDCAACDLPCDDAHQNGGGTIVGAGGPIWDGKTYEQYVMDKYGDLGELPSGWDCDWDSELAGSASGGRGRICVVSTGKSDWPRDHTDDRTTLSYHLSRYLSSLPPESFEHVPRMPKSKDFNTRPPIENVILPATMPPPSTSAPAIPNSLPPPSLYSSSLISQSDDPEDQSVIVFPDWKVVHEVENSKDGAKGFWDGVLKGSLGRAGAPVMGEADTVARRRSWVLPYRAVVLLCSHKHRDKRCSIAAPLLRSALETVFAKHNITVDSTGSSLTHLAGPPLEEVEGSVAEREVEVGRRIENIESVHGGEGGEVGVFNINHLGGHRYAGVMLILFPSGAYLSYGRLTPQEIPRVVEETILKGKVVPGYLRNAVGVRVGQPEGDGKGCGFLSW